MIALKKGHKNYVTLITRRNGGEVRLSAVIEGREKSKINGFLKNIPARLKKTVEAVCTDMCDAYVNAAQEVFKKKAIVVIDRFHVRSYIEKVWINIVRKFSKSSNRDYRPLNTKS